MRLVVLSITVVLVFGACSRASEPTGESSSDTSSSAGGSTAITAADNEFDPTELALPPGEEVILTFTNEGETIHTFTSEELGFDTGNVDPGDSAEVAFTAPEEETRFVCTIHAETDDMVGTIVPE